MELKCNKHPGRRALILASYNLHGAFLCVSPVDVDVDAQFCVAGLVMM